MKSRIVVPIKFRWKKVQKKKVKGVSLKTTCVLGNKGYIYIKALETTRMSLQQMEAIRVHLSRRLKKKVGIFSFRIFPTYRFSMKSAQSRMGKGKGLAYSWWAPIHKNKMIIAIQLRRIKPWSKLLILDCLKEIQYMFSFKTKIVEEKSIYD